MVLVHGVWADGSAGSDLAGESGHKQRLLIDSVLLFATTFGQGLLRGASGCLLLGLGNSCGRYVRFLYGPRRA